MFTMIRFVAISIVLLAVPLRAAEFGHVTGRIVFEGKRPAAAVAATNAPAICVPGGVVADESLVVGEKGGVANVFVYLAERPGVVHPDLVQPPRDAVRFTQEGCVFEPHALVARVGGTVEVESLDPVPHNMQTFPIRNVATNFVLPAAPAPAERVTLPKAEVMPFKVKCGFYPWMRAYWLVLDHPYAAITGADGRFTIRNLHAGRHELRVWHERAGYLERRLVVDVPTNGTAAIEPIVCRMSDFE